jgi:adenosylmethionine-8-amino-7-oxononanoate aminotransferase
MNDFIILGTDTDAGKTTFALLWLALFHQEFEYWKPVETGESDTEKVRRLVPEAHCHHPVISLAQPVAPALAARGAGIRMPKAAALAQQKPAPTVATRRLIVETFGSALSPLNRKELQVEFIRRLDLPTVLVSSSALGAIGRTLQGLLALRRYGIRPAAVVLVGARDAYAAAEIHHHSRQVPVYSLELPERWDVAGVGQTAKRQEALLQQVRQSVCAARPQLPDKLLPSFEDAKALLQTARDSLLRRDRQYVWHPYTPLLDADPPQVVIGAEAEFLLLADGRKLIDGISSWWTILHGHRHAPLMQALTEAYRILDHVQFAGATHPAAVSLAELLLHTAPWSGAGRVFYSDNGSTAVEVALKMAYQFWCHRGEPERTLFVGFEHGYHGDTFGAMAAGRDPVFFGRFEPLLFKTVILPVSAHELAQTLQQHQGHVAAVILEPLVQGAGGMRMHSPDELRAIAEVAHANDVLFIADEVMTGGGRLGPLWAHQEARIQPDLICAAKTLTGGLLPLAATLVAPHVAAAFETDDRSQIFFHGHSFTAHPPACAVAAANLALLTAGEITAPRRMEALWRQALAPLQEHPRVREVRFRGSIAAVELDGPGGYLADIGQQLRATCLERGVLLRPLGNVLYAMPPFCTSDDSLEQIASAMIAALHSIAI